MRFVLYRLPLLLYMGLIYYLSSGPITSSIARMFPDYVLHAAAYAVMFILAFRAVHEGMRLRPGRGGYWLPAFITIGYGASDEFHQSFVPGRDASLTDLVSDTMGAVIGHWAILLLRGIRGVRTHANSTKSGSQ